MAVFTLAAVLALLYLFEDRQLKRKQFDRMMGPGDPAGDARPPGAPLRVDRLPDLHGRHRDRRDLGGAAGASCARRRRCVRSTCFALATWAAFGVLLVARVGAGWRGRRAAWLTLGGFGGAMLVLLAYFLRHAA